MSSTTRELAITYGGYATGAAATRPIHGYRVTATDRDRMTVTWDFVVISASEADFASDIQAVEAAFRTPYGNLTIVQGSATILDLSQSANTGLDAMPSVQKVPGPHNTGRSQLFRASVSFGLPASWGAVSGLRTYSTEVSYTGSRRASVVLSGEFTAVGGSDAYALYQAGISTLVTAAMSFFSIATYELAEEPRVNVSVNKKTCSFVRVYRQLITEQADSAKIRNQLVVVTRTRQSVENSPLGSDGGTSSGSVIPLCDLSATWSCDVDKGQTQDLADLWEDSIRAFAIEAVQAASGSSQFALTSDSPSFNYDENKITARIVGVCPDPEGSSVISYRYERREQEQGPTAFLPAWTGDPLAAFVYSPVLVRTRLTTVTRKTVNTDAASAGGGASSASLPGTSPPVGGGGTMNSGLMGFGIGGGPTAGAGLYGAYDPPGASGSFFDVDLTGYANAQRGARGEPPIGSSNGAAGAAPPAGAGGNVNGDGGGNGDGGSQDGAGSQAGPATWYVIDRARTSVPWELGRPPFSIRGQQTTTVTLERQAKPIRGRRSST